MVERKQRTTEAWTDRERTGLAHVRPETPNQLHAWLARALGVRTPRWALLADHRAPFEYLCHTYFEGRFGGAQPDSTDCVVWANRGGGKTFLGAVATTLDLLFKPGIEIRILGGSLEQSRRMHEHLRSMLTQPALAPMTRSVTVKGVELRNGSRAEILAQSQTSVRGARVQKLRCDEVELFDREVWDAAQLVTRSMLCPGPWGDEVVGGVEALSTMHRPFGLMWDLVTRASESERGRLFRWGVVDVLEHCGPQRACAPCPLLDECGGRAKTRPPAHAGHVRIDDAIAMKRRVDTATWTSEMLCRRPRRTDAVLPEFDIATHVTRDDPPAADALRIAGMDFGFRGETAVLWASVLADGAVLVTRERVLAGVRLDDHAMALKEGDPPGWIGVDPAGRQRSDQTGLSAITALRKHGLRIRARRLGVQEGLSLVRARLRPADESFGPRLFVHARCERLIESLLWYHYPRDKPGSLEPVKDGADHAVDALRYMIVNLDRPATATARSYV